MDVPSIPRQLLYLNRFKVRAEHHPWMRMTLTETEPQRLGRMIGAANASAFFLFGILMMAAGGGVLGLTLLALAVVAAGLAQVPTFLRLRVRQLANTNDIDTPDWAE
ncbi:MAG: hypothetical protein AAGA17_20685 [Actinomycetota bacterium]